jgi:hypothetical protein
MDSNLEHIARPGKQAIRDWLRQRQLKSGPPPDIAQIRHQLGWTGASSRQAAPSSVGTMPGPQRCQTIDFP